MFCTVVLLATALSAGDNEKRCTKCGMDLSKYTHSAYIIEWKDGTTSKTCGVQCGLSLTLKNFDNYESAEATDLITNRKFPAVKGFYVFKSTVTTDMGPGFIAFMSRENADKFQKGFNGQVLTFQEALDNWKNFLEKK